MVAPAPVSTPSAVIDVAALRRQTGELEGVFLDTLMRTMFSSIKTDGAFGGGFGEETWRGMQAEQYARSVAQAGGIGLADQIVSNLLGVQQAQGLPHAVSSPSAAIEVHE